MNRQNKGVFLLFLLIGACLLSLRMMPAAKAVSAAGTVPAQSVSRTLDPVILTGAQVADLGGTKVDDLFLYSYLSGAWTQVPFQVDELASGGAYVATEDNTLDSNDEIVFVAQDLGAQSGTSNPISTTLPTDAVLYEIAVTDPVSPTAQGWAYLVASATLTNSVTTDYVSFDAAAHRLSGTSYKIGFATPRSYIDYLTLGSSDVDLLDRLKLRLLCRNPLLCPVTEEFGTVSDGLIKDGPVRVILRDGRVFAYPAMLSWSSTVPIPLQGDVRASMDFSAAAVGSTIYSTAVPTGTLVDGIPDAVAAEPASPWFQLSTTDGTFIQVSDLELLGGTKTNYYKDDSTIDPNDTGDKQSFGETGIQIANPGSSVNYNFVIYALAGAQPNVGAQYASYAEQPLTVTATSLQAPAPANSNLYLPVVRK